MEYTKLNKYLLIATLVACIALILALAIGIPLTQNKNPNNELKARRLLNQYPLIDGHNDLPSMVRKNFKNKFNEFDFNDLNKIRDKLNGTEGVTHTDVLRLKQGKLGAQFWAAYASCESLAKDATRIHLEQLDMMKRLIKKFPHFLKYVDNSKDLIKVFNEGKIASLIGLESGHAIDSSLAILRIFYNLGVRYMTLTHNCDVPWATNNRVDRLPNSTDYGGLTDFGRKVIQEMNRLGMIVDLSHVSYQTMLDALDESKAPVMFSHSSVYSLCNHVRNVRDDVLLKLKANQGIIMINFYNGFVACDENNGTVMNVVEHLNKVKELIGIDNIGIGSDFDGVPNTPDGLDDVSKYPNLFKKLLDAGWSENELIKLAGGNILRVLSQVENYAASVKQFSPLDDIISQNDLQPEFKKCRTLLKSLKMSNNWIKVKLSNRKDYVITACFFLAFCLVIGLTLGVVLRETNNLTKARKLLENNPLIDGHNDLPYMIRENFQNRFGKFDLNDFSKIDPFEIQGTDGVIHTDILRLKKGKLGGQFWASYADCNSTGKDAVRLHLEQIDVIKRYIKKYNQVFQYATSSKEIKDAFKRGKIASLIGVESGHAIDSSLAVLRIFYNLGARYMTLTHNCDVPWATNNRVDRLPNSTDYGGLTDFGRKVIQEMNRLGMIVDLSHVSYQTMLDALDESKAPVMFSHSSVYSLCNHVRNVRDDVLLKLKANQGIIMINFYNGFVACDSNNASITNVIEHLNYVKNLIGIDHIGIGSDYDGVDKTPRGLEDVSKFPGLFQKLLDLKWSEEDLIKLAGGNILRVISQVEKYSQSMIRSEPLDDIIKQDDIKPELKKCRTSF
ncbi:unnamed protein product [Brachionus calyciflorus]|uniref:Dipeptidase n=1 Tax=Brachionus calyciflorus TaxID=104777 RepID=A0A813RPW0_9BILA|nr:unnamed protein product [Brachionus calyciflorus]